MIITETRIDPSQSIQSPHHQTGPCKQQNGQTDFKNQKCAERSLAPRPLGRSTGGVLQSGLQVRARGLEGRDYAEQNPASQRQADSENQNGEVESDARQPRKALRSQGAK